jgi:hypothetical protein
VHLFNSHGGKLPINVQVLAISDKDSPEQKTIADVQLALDKPGEECGVMHIWWDEKSHYIPASLQTYPKLGTMQIATSGQPESAAPTCTQRENPL